MTSTSLAKLKKFSLVLSAVGVAATAGLLIKLFADLDECTQFLGNDFCMDAYIENTTRGKFVVYGSGLFALVAIAGIAGLVAWFIKSRAQEKTPLTPEELELRAAEKEYRSAVRQAEKAHRTTIKGLDKSVKQAAKALRDANEMGQRRLGKRGSAVLYEDRIETPEGTAFLAEESVQSDLNPSGNLVIKTASFKTFIEGKIDQIQKAREFEAKLAQAVAAAPKLKEQKTQAIATARAALIEANGNLKTGTVEADAVLAGAKADTARLEAAKARVNKTAAADTTVT